MKGRNGNGRIQDRLRRKEAALEQLHAQINHEKSIIRDLIHSKLKRLVFPILEKMRSEVTPTGRGWLEILRYNLDHLTAPFGRKTAQYRWQGLTPRESEIARMLVHDLTTQQISELLGIAITTVEAHRNAIRKRLKIRHKYVNLVNHLKRLK